MALAEARAVLHRTANRCLVQEDAKRAPKLACCSSIPSSVKQENVVSNVTGGRNVPCAVYTPFNLNPSFSGLSPNSKWWLHRQPYGYQKGSMDGKFSYIEGSMEICQKNESSGNLGLNDDNPRLTDQTTPKRLLCTNQARSVTTGAELHFGVEEDGVGRFSSWNLQDPLKLEGKYGVKELTVENIGPEVSKSSKEPCFDLKSSLIGAGKNAPWWRTADTDELASLVAQRSLDYIENCDLPMPQNTRVKVHDELSASFTDPKHGAGDHHRHGSRLHTVGNLTSGRASQKLSVLAGGPLRYLDTSDIPIHQTTVETHMFENNASKAQLMEALRHSQTRARKAERAAKQACAEKEHAVKLVFRQASQLFAYKQWLHLLLLEKLYLGRTKETQRTRHNSSSRKRPRYEASKYEVVFGIGLGLAGAGFLLGWTIAWMFPSW